MLKIKELEEKLQRQTKKYMQIIHNKSLAVMDAKKCARETEAKALDQKEHVHMLREEYNHPSVKLDIDLQQHPRTPLAAE